MNTALTPETQRGRLIAGAILLFIGTILAVGQVLPDGLTRYLILPAISLVFILSGLLTRKVGLLIPGGILAGVGLGSVLASETLFQVGGFSFAEPGGFFFGFAAGWALIPLLAAAIGQRLLWPFIPATILLVLGGLLISGEQGETVLSAIGQWWPLLLIAIGAVSLINALRRPSVQ